MEKEIIQAISQIETKILWLIFLALIAYHVVNYLKSWSQILAERRAFMNLPYVGPGVRVTVGGFKGELSLVGLKVIVVKNSAQRRVIHVTRWRYFTWDFDVCEKGGS